MCPDSAAVQAILGWEKVFLLVYEDIELRNQGKTIGGK
jgi:hypothetical protein